jgi:hypothetical protein
MNSKHHEYVSSMKRSDELKYIVNMYNVSSMKRSDELKYIVNICLRRRKMMNYTL